MMRGRALMLMIQLSMGCGTGGSEAEMLYNKWEPLLTKPWMLPPGGENPHDGALIDIDSDIYVGGFRPISPPGTHHTLVGRGAAFNALTDDIIYASGVETNELKFPEGIGLKLPAGSLVGVQLHTFNPSDQPLTGISGVEIFRIAPEDVVDDADLVLAGPEQFEIPPGDTTVTAHCTIASRQTVFALFPHMHNLGTHFKTTLTIGGVDRVIHDGPYSFEHQPFLVLEPIVLEPGDTITTECTWTNPGTETVLYGESSTTEMCFSIMYRYPAQDDVFCYQ